MKQYTNDPGLSRELVNKIAKFYKRDPESLGLRVEKQMDHQGHTLFVIRSNIKFHVKRST